MTELKPCPFCGGKAKLSFADVEFGGRNYNGEKKTKYRFMVICNRCHARGKPVKTDFLINANPWRSEWSGWGWYAFLGEEIKAQTELVRPWAEKAIAARNRRAKDDG